MPKHVFGTHTFTKIIAVGKTPQTARGIRRAGTLHRPPLGN